VIFIYEGTETDNEFMSVSEMRAACVSSLGIIYLSSTAEQLMLAVLDASLCHSVAEGMLNAGFS
jgi:hypothetical protein